MKLQQIQLSISGHVQGVGFRYSTQKEGRRLAIVGWVRNLPDGSVEALAEGTEEQIGEFLKWCAQGPTGSKVEGVRVLSRKQVEKLSFGEFEIRR